MFSQSPIQSYLDQAKKEGLDVSWGHTPREKKSYWLRNNSSGYVLWISGDQWSEDALYYKSLLCFFNSIARTESEAVARRILPPEAARAAYVDAVVMLPPLFVACPLSNQPVPVANFFEEIITLNSGSRFTEAGAILQRSAQYCEEQEALATQRVKFSMREWPVCKHSGEALTLSWGLDWSDPNQESALHKAYWTCVYCASVGKTSK